MKYDVIRGIRWSTSKGGTQRAADPGDVVDDVKLKGADVDWLIGKGAIVPKPTKGADDGSR